jgi:hypothetical protein
MRRESDATSVRETRMRKIYNILAGKPKKRDRTKIKKQKGNNNKMNIKETGNEDVYWIHVVKVEVR